MAPPAVPVTAACLPVPPETLADSDVTVEAQLEFKFQVQVELRDLKYDPLALGARGPGGYCAINCGDNGLAFQ